MATTVGSVNLGYNASPIVLSTAALASAAAFAITFAANQVGILNAFLMVQLPADHGGFALNWLMPNSTWPFSALCHDWSIVEVGTEASPSFIYTPAINNGSSNSLAIIARPEARARTLRVRGSAEFKAPAGGGIINLQGQLLDASKAAVTILAGSRVTAELF